MKFWQICISNYSLSFLLYVHDMNQVVDCDLCMQITLIQFISTEILKKFIKISTNIFLISIIGLSNHFGDDKTKITLFCTKRKLNKVLIVLILDMAQYQPSKYHTVTYRSCSLNRSLSGLSVALKVIEKHNNRLRLLYRSNKFLSLPLCRLFCNALIQPHFDYAC